MRKALKRTIERRKRRKKENETVNRILTSSGGWMPERDCDGNLVMVCVRTREWRYPTEEERARFDNDNDDGDADE